jgi:peptide/nickel transport system permease protein
MTAVAGRVLRTIARLGVKIVPAVLGITLLNFFLLQLVPGDAADVMAGESGAATAETMAYWRHQYGLDLPLMGRFRLFLENLSHFSLGYSPRFGLPVTTLIAQRLPNTLMLMIAALAIAVVLGLVLGATMAAFVKRRADRALSVLSLLFYSVPNFWIGLMFIVLFSVKLGWLPSGGAETIGMSLDGAEMVIDKLRHLVLPALSLGLIYIGTYARLSRAAVLDVIGQDYVRTARAKGVRPARIMIHHVLRNALIPITTMIGTHVAGVLGGAVVVETVFSWPGLGSLAYEAVMSRDFGLLLGILFVSSLVVIVVNVASDAVQLWLDPRLANQA